MVKFKCEYRLLKAFMGYVASMCVKRITHLFLGSRPEEKKFSHFGVERFSAVSVGCEGQGIHVEQRPGGCQGHFSTIKRPMFFSRRI